ncbi:LLM class flavin-dependent oxidoreductase [Hymenobacter aquaticus]|uniref:LLM class flavin-dependent oxidoreductase n=1 Tax=Hymenobacter aquaticus TaxID=1867101 RepID=A0A4Z0Q5Y9_9BACT|nr:LLM class flavin-dependent oxidoreductase [Hymenobacter aquaticus]TGE25510.1 LLM class flavin-dependent oxidoreductase [Hymenobacter aquaticus]
MINVGLLDFCLDDQTNSHQEQLQIAIYTAQHAEEHGCCSIWYGEHHEGAFQVSPTLMASIVLSQTTTITAGTGGVLASYYSPLEMAYAASLLDCAYPNRFELGLARGNPSPEKKAMLLDSRPAASSGTDFFERVQSTRRLLHGADGVSVAPTGTRPKLWLLGMGSQSAIVAGKNGAAYCHAAFLKGSGSPEDAFREYTANFVAQRPGEAPEYALALSVCSDQHDGVACYNRFEHNPSFTNNMMLPPAALARELAQQVAHYGLSRLVLLQAEASYLHRLATLEALMRELPTQ